MSAPRSPTQGEVELAARMRSEGAPVSAICRALGVGKSTWYRWMREGAEMRAAAEQMRRELDQGEEMLDAVLSGPESGELYGPREWLLVACACWERLNKEPLPVHDFADEADFKQAVIGAMRQLFETAERDREEGIAA